MKRRPKIVKIYLLQVKGFEIYKIGYTTITIAERIAVIKMYIPNIRFVDAAMCDFRYEKMFHRRFADKKADFRGYHEYFNLSAKDVEFVRYFMKRIKSVTDWTVDSENLSQIYRI